MERAARRRLDREGWVHEWSGWFRQRRGRRIQHGRGQAGALRRDHRRRRRDHSRRRRLRDRRSSFVANGNFDAVVISLPLSISFRKQGVVERASDLHSLHFRWTAKDWALYSACQCGKAARRRKQCHPTGAVAPCRRHIRRGGSPEVSIPGYHKYVLIRGTVSASGRFEDLRW